jgi:hypothetical protein
MFKCCFSTSAEEPKKLPSGPISVAVKVAEKPVMLKFRMSPDAECDADADVQKEPQAKEKAVFSVLPAAQLASPSSLEASPAAAAAQTPEKSVLSAALVIGALYEYFYYNVSEHV